MKYLYCFNSHSDFYNKDMVLKDDNVVLCKDTDINKWHAHYHHPPYDAQIEYLECTGIQWIDPDYNSGNSSIISITAQLTSLTAQCRIIGNNSGYLEIYINGSAKWGAASNGTTVNSNITADTNVHIFKIDNVANKAYSDNSSWNITHNGASYYNKVGLFGRLNNNTGCTGKIYSARIYEGNTLIRDLIPVRVGTTGYMYDKISGRFFGNAGTGNFTLGQDIIPIEYIQSTAKTQYINTGVKACMNKIRCVCDMAPMNTADSAFFGSRGTYYLFYCVGSNYFWPISKCNTINGTLQTNKKYHIDWNKGNFTLTGENGVYQQGSRSNTTQDANPMYIFNFNPIDNNSRYGNAKLYYFKIYVDDVLVRDFSPVRVGTVGYLFDKVNRQLYGNAGSGAFTLGPDI